MVIQGMEIDESYLSSYELEEINKLLSSHSENMLTLDDLWSMMDKVWHDSECQQHSPTADSLSKYYSHPIWVLNGLFSEQDIDSKKNRQKIVNWVMAHKPEISKILDFGGGIGSLARSLAQASDGLNVLVYEPAPHAIALDQLKHYKNVQYTDSIDQLYDCIICLDVMEHLLDPLQVLETLVKATRPNGYLIFGNCFFPVIQCHLPQTFHLRYTFPLFARLMGLNPVSSLHRSYITVFQREHSVLVHWPTVRWLESISKLCYPLLNAAHMTCRRLKLG